MQIAYWYGSTNGNLNSDSSPYASVTSAANLQTCFHVFELIWEQNQLTYLLDGVVVATKLETSTTLVGDLFGKMENLVLNVAVGGSYFNGIKKWSNSKILPGNMSVDWVRVYRAT